MGRQNAHQMVDTVYAALHRSILDRRLRPGQKLREQALGELFNVSRTTVRAALQRLESEGLVTIEPNKGASVSLPSVSEVNDLFRVRLVVETGIAVDLCGRQPAPLIKRLREHLDKEQRAMAANDYKTMSKLQGEFHMLLAEATESRNLIEFLTGIISRTSLVIAAFDDETHSACRSDEHKTLVDCIESGNTAGAITCMREHLGDIEVAVTAKAQQIEDGYHPMQHLLGEM
jgi:DNA-binding GntR family transcriptional regulator